MHPSEKPEDDSAAKGDQPPPGTKGSGHSDAEDGEKRKPIASWRLMSDEMTSIELEVWSNMIRSENGDSEELSYTVSRSSKTDTGWVKGGAWCTHDIPVVTFLLAKAHAFALERRLDLPD